MTTFRDLIDKIFNWSGGAVAGLSTLTVLGLAVAEFATGTPMVVSFPDGRSQIFIVHQAPQWFVGFVGLYTAILTLFWAGKPLNRYIDAKSGAITADAQNAPPKP